MNSEEEDRAAELLDKWYKADKKTELEMLTANVQEIPISFGDMINYNKKLFYIGKVTKVPSIFVNGFTLPENNSLEDIKYHISDLINLKNELVEIEI